MVTLCAFPYNLNPAVLKNGPAPGSERPTFVSTALCAQATCSAMHNGPALQEERAGGHEWDICALRVILPKQEVAIEIIVYMDTNLNKNQHKPLLSILFRMNWITIFKLTCSYKAFFSDQPFYSEYLCPCKLNYRCLQTL